MIVIASIHQPSTSTLLLFDDVLLLSEGRPVYYGPPDDSPRHFQSLGFAPPPLVSTAEFMLDLTSTDFHRDGERVSRLDSLFHGWSQSPENRLLCSGIEATQNKNSSGDTTLIKHRARGYARSLPMQTLILFHRMALV